MRSRSLSNATGSLLRIFLSCVGLALAGNAPAQAQVPAHGDAKRGQYLIKAAGCMGCHTAEKKDGKDGVPFAGGRALKTPFGTFFGPNITPHPQAGIGRWTEADFVRAMREGRRPDGAHYFPAFPYPSFTKIADGDLRDLWAYLRMVPPSAQPSQAHELRFPFGWRFLIAVWKWLFFTPGPMSADPKLTLVQARGAYLVNALGHCGECHTPRNFLGGAKKDRLLAGTNASEGVKSTANLTPAALKKWSDDELKEYLTTGQTPDGDSANSTMMEVITNTTSQLAAQDLAALIAYLRAVPAVESEK
jgi:mono/diheme cytochrome c family protein